MKAYAALPKGYIKTRSIDLQKDKKTALIVNGVALAICAVMIAAMAFIVPIRSLIDFDNGDAGMAETLARVMIMLAGSLIYIVLHELTHAAAMKVVGCKKVRFGFTGIYAYAGSPGEYFDKPAYIFISLAPLVLFGVIFIVLQFTVPKTWFWVIWIWQIANVSGAAGDIYVSFLTASLPKTVIASDDGVSMTYYDIDPESTEGK